MNRSVKRILQGAVAIAAAAAVLVSTAQAAEKKEFKVAWSIYVGWMPWGYASDTGIVKKWADKYGIKIEVKQFNDYVESINQYTAGAFDAVTVTNMDALSIPAAGGVDTTAVIVGDFSNGNDAVIVKDKGDARRHQGHRTSTSSSSRCRTTCWRARSRCVEAGREGPQGRQHVRRRHGRRLQDAGRHGRRDLEADRLDHPGIAGRQEGVRQFADPRRDHRPHGRQHRGAEGQPEVRARRWPASGTTRWPRWSKDPAAKEAMAKASGTDVKGFDEQLATTKLFCRTRRTPSPSPPAPT